MFQAVSANRSSVTNRRTRWNGNAGGYNKVDFGTIRL